jgi:hypothetical protein
MDFDIEIAVRLSWRNVPPDPSADRRDLSGRRDVEFRMVADNALITKLHTKLSSAC